MADSYLIYTASGSTDTFSIPFGYLDPAHVFVSVDNVDVSFTFPSESQAQLDGGNPANGAIVKVYRVTPRDNREVVWSNAANLTAGDLNTADLQMLYIVQEAFDTAEDALFKDNSGIYDADGIRIQNVGTPIASDDATNKAYVDASTIDIVDDAEDARDAAQGYAADAAAALAACQTIYDNFDDRYLGQKSSEPTLDNDGNALIDGALYYNTVDNKMYVYDLGTTTWLAIEQNIPNDSITNAKLANVATNTIKGRATASTGDPEDLTPTQARSVMSVYSQSEVDAAIAVKSTFAADTEQATTSGTAFDFTGIPATAKRVIISFYNVGLSGSDNILVQIGDSGGIENTGYISSAACVRVTTSPTGATATDGFVTNGDNVINNFSGQMILTALDAGGTKWASSHVASVNSGSGNQSIGGGNKTLSARLDRVRITRTGSNTFDTGSVNITYE